jgi:hypothetical protein
MTIRTTLLVAILIAQAALTLVTVDIGHTVREIQQTRPDPNLDKLTADIQRLTHPDTIQRRTVDWILRQGEFKGVK